MRAVVCEQFGDEDLLELRELPDLPPPGSGQVLIDVHAASVNFPDALMIRGQYQVKPDLPFFPGTECSGRVRAVGPGVDGVQEGDRVLSLVGFGAFATEALATPPQQHVFRIPDAMPWDEAAAFDITYGTAMLGLHQRGRVQAGETVLVLGAAGGCGSAAVQIARAMGATVIAAAGGPEKCRLALDLGAIHAIDYLAEPSLSGAVKELTDGRGVDVVFDTVGGDGVRDSLRCLAWDGRYLVVGFAAGCVPQVGLNQTILKSIALVGVAYGASVIRDPALAAANFDRLFEWYGEGLVPPVIGHRFPLADAADAIRVVSGRGALGKVVIEVAP